MKILVYKAKHGDVYFDATASVASAFLAMFKYIDRLNYYGEGWMPRHDWEQVSIARAGDPIAARDLLRRRRLHEYEGWSIETVIVPEEGDDNVKTITS